MARRDSAAWCILVCALQLVIGATDAAQPQLGEANPVLVPPGHISSSLLIPGDRTNDPELEKLVSGLIGSMRKAEAEGKPPPRAIYPRGLGHTTYQTDTTPLNHWMPGYRQSRVDATLR